MSLESNSEAGEMRSEYEINGGVRGKYFDRYQNGTNVVVLDTDVAAAFPNSESVNRALRVLIEVAKRQAGGA